MQFETQRLNIILIDRVLPQSQKRKTVEMLCLYIQQQAFLKFQLLFKNQLLCADSYFNWIDFNLGFSVRILSHGFMYFNIALFASVQIV